MSDLTRDELLRILEKTVEGNCERCEAYAAQAPDPTTKQKK